VNIIVVAPADGGLNVKVLLELSNNAQEGLFVKVIVKRSYSGSLIVGRT
jgi:hypothetical protein